MSCGEGDAEPGRTTRNGWVANGRDVEAARAQFDCDGNGSGFIAQNERNNRGWKNIFRRRRREESLAFCGGRFETPHVVSYKLDVPPKLVAPRFAFGGLHKSDSCIRCGCCGRDGRGTKDETAGAVHEKFDELATATGVATACAKGFAERAHLNFNPVADAKFFGQAATIFSVK